MFDPNLSAESTAQASMVTLSDAAASVAWPWLAWGDAGLVGFALGGLFFAGLWWTVRRGSASHRPAVWFGASALARTVMVCWGFWWVGADDWTRWLACGVGFFLARACVLWLTRVAAPALPNLRPVVIPTVAQRLPKEAPCD